MTVGRDLLTKAETFTVEAIETGVPTMVEAREFIAEFHLMIRRKTETSLIPWIERARASLVASFASGVARDEAAVRAAITLPWSNGQDRRSDHAPQARQASNVWPREDRFASSQTNRRGMKGAAPKLRQSQYCRPNDSKHGISSATFYKWKAKYVGADVSEAHRLKILTDVEAVGRGDVRQRHAE